MEYNLLFEQNLSNELVMTPAEFKQNYLFGTDLETQDGLRTMLNETIVQKLLASQKFVEDLLDLKLKKQIIHESRDFISEEFRQWGYIHTSYHVNKVFELEGWLNNVVQIKYPQQWLSTKATNDGTYYRQIFIVPGVGSLTPIFATYSGLYGNWGLMNYSYIPQYWRLSYCTGFEVLPHDVKNYIGKLAAIEVLAIMGDLLLGAGIAAKSVHFDGLTQRISTTQGNGNSVFSARINIYRKDIVELKDLLIKRYKGITMYNM